MQTLANIFNIISILQETLTDNLTLPSEKSFYITWLHHYLKKFSNDVMEKCTSFKVSGDLLPIIYFELLPKENFSDIKSKLDFVKENIETLFSQDDGEVEYIMTVLILAVTIKESIISADHKPVESKQGIELSLQDQILCLNKKISLLEEEKKSNDDLEKELKLLFQIKQVVTELNTTPVEQYTIEKEKNNAPHYEQMAQAMLKLPINCILQVIEEDFQIARVTPEKIDLILYWMGILDVYHQEYISTKNIAIGARINLIFTLILSHISQVTQRIEVLEKKSALYQEFIDNNLKILDFSNCPPNEIKSTFETELEIYKILNMRNNTNFLTSIVIEISKKIPSSDEKKQNDNAYTQLINQIKNIYNHQSITSKPLKIALMIADNMQTHHYPADFYEIFFSCATAAGICLPKSLFPARKTVSTQERLMSTLYQLSGMFSMKKNSVSSSVANEETLPKTMRDT